MKTMKIVLIAAFFVSSGAIKVLDAADISFTDDSNVTGATNEVSKPTEEQVKVEPSIARSAGRSRVRSAAVVRSREESEAVNQVDQKKIEAPEVTPSAKGEALDTGAVAPIKTPVETSVPVEAPKSVELPLEQKIEKPMESSGVKPVEQVVDAPKAVPAVESTPAATLTPIIPQIESKIESSIENKSGNDELKVEQKKNIEEKEEKKDAVKAAQPVALSPTVPLTSPAVSAANDDAAEAAELEKFFKGIAQEQADEKLQF